MGISAIQKTNVSEQVYEQLREQLLAGEWRPDDKLPSENELAALFGVSRVTVRQALQRMAAQGLLETRLGEGTFVRRYTPGLFMANVIPAAFLTGSPLADVLEFRRMIEAPTAELAIQKATDGDILALGEIYERMSAARLSDKAFFRADFEFHLQFALMTRNSLLAETYRVLQDIFLYGMKEVVRARGHSQGLYYHGLLLEAARGRDAVRCGKIMAEHIENTYEDMKTKNQ
ncbi:MAG: FadR family transcriptional regulator [Clostridiales bacterium]|jgi:GntR family transcriptional repressor for pyruvate dehydrogenase complex|nr:FadR family transcriptional regulator [Clostridiales bacterium]